MRSGSLAYVAAISSCARFLPQRPLGHSALLLGLDGGSLSENFLVEVRLNAASLAFRALLSFSMGCANAG